MAACVGWRWMNQIIQFALDDLAPYTLFFLFTIFGHYSIQFDILELCTHKPIQRCKCIYVWCMIGFLILLSFLFFGFNNFFFILVFVCAALHWRRSNELCGFVFGYNKSIIKPAQKKINIKWIQYITCNEIAELSGSTIATIKIY